MSELEKEVDRLAQANSDLEELLRAEQDGRQQQSQELEKFKLYLPEADKLLKEMNERHTGDQQELADL